jgi:hypothetical protein
MGQEKIVIRWDEASIPAQWNVKVFRPDSEGRELPSLSSAAPGFPVRVGDFGPMEEDSLIMALRKVFPEAHINILF